MTICEELKKAGVTEGSEPMTKMFEVKEIESDISFIRNYLTKDLVMRRFVLVSKTRERLQSHR
ncbi:hypothetical protein ACEQPO_07230 [Bacillus sp. SL00103]